MIAQDTNEVENRGEPIGDILWRGRQWAVTDYGLEALDGSYPIAAERLHESHSGSTWIIQVGGKTWVDKADFATAFMVAIVLHDKAQHIDPRLIREDYEAVSRPSRSFEAERP
jgi:hypothetical protein